jgi:hypothetical protein
MSIEKIPEFTAPAAKLDKAQHALGFAGLAFLGLMAYPGRVRVRVLMLGLALFGAGIELAQWLTGWRQGDWQD